MDFTVTEEVAVDTWRASERLGYQEDENQVGKLQRRCPAGVAQLGAG